VPESRLLIVFVKAPRAGFVKTRLAQIIGAKAACEAYCQIIEELWRRLRPLRNVQLRFSPSDAASEAQRWQQPGWTMSPQGDGDLGTRLTNAFADAFAAGAQRVAIIGSDCPYLTVNDIEQAWACLTDHDVALGPAVDGGYWLVALKQLHGEIFREIGWGTSEVLSQTIDRAHTAHLRVHRLRELSDIDTKDDWRNYLNSFASRRPLR